MDQKKPLEKVDGVANSTPYQNGSEKHESLTPRGSISVWVTVKNESTNYNIINNRWIPTIFLSIELIDLLNTNSSRSFFF